MIYIMNKREIIKEVETNKIVKLTEADNTTTLTNQFIKDKIIKVKDKLVIIDRDVAEIYGVETREINQAIKNNPEKFPDRYIIELDKSIKNELIKNFDRFNSLKHSTASIKAFTEQGLYMLATILKGEIATKMTIQIIDAFTELREVAYNLDKAADSKTEDNMGIYLNEAGNRLSQLLLQNITPDNDKKVKTTLEINLGIFRAKIEIENSKK